MGWETGCQRETEHDINFGKNHGTLGCKNIKMFQYDNTPELKNAKKHYISSCPSVSACYFFVRP